MVGMFGFKMRRGGVGAGVRGGEGCAGREIDI